jgi:hypothetical protein
LGDGEPVRPPYREFSVLRFCQNMRGEVTDSMGEDWKGDESVLMDIFLGGDARCQLGEFRLFSVGEISDSGRGVPLLGAFVGDGLLLFAMRKGCTGSDAMVVMRDMEAMPGGKASARDEREKRGCNEMK